MVASIEETTDKQESCTLWEQETIINFFKSDDMASIYTHEKTWQQHIEEVLGIQPFRKHGSAREYLVPKKWLRLPRKPSEKRREAGRLRALKQPVGSPKNPKKSGETPYTQGKQTPKIKNPSPTTRRGNSCHQLNLKIPKS